jgi:GH24 family phage-related lysozyme (muramidase)/peptidoglycan hydrolase-like protein with peptidoglycan-binding domain
MALRSSQRAITFIVNSEVSSPQAYTRLYQRPTWPHGASGVTVGIGYDLGYSNAAKITNDWRGHVSAAMLSAMVSCAGITGDAARSACARVKSQINIPLADAMYVFEEVDMPRWEQIVLRALPGSDKLSGDSFGALVSLTYNRGASYQKKRDPNDAIDRYREMRAIRAALIAGQPELVPDLIRSMTRIWRGKDNMSGLLARREDEARMFEDGLEAQVEPLVDEAPAKIDTGDDKTLVDAPVTPTGTELNVQKERATFDLDVQVLQQALIGRGYHEVGNADGLWGGRTRAAISAFMNDRGQITDGTITPTLKIEINKAVAEGWTRPISPARANATAADIAPKVASVNQTWYTKLWAWVLGLGSSAVAAFKSVFGDYNDPGSYIYSVKSFFGAIPVEYYFLAVAGVAVFILVQASRAQNATVAAYQKGEIN